MGSHVPPARENEARERSLPSLSGLMQQYSSSRVRPATRGGYSSSARGVGGTGAGVGAGAGAGTGAGGPGGYFGSSTATSAAATTAAGAPTAATATAFTNNRALDRSELALSTLSSERSSSPLSFAGLGSRTQPAGLATSTSSTTKPTTTTTTGTATNTAATATATSTSTGVSGTGAGTGSALGTGHLRPPPHRLLPGLGLGANSPGGSSE